MHDRTLTVQAKFTDAFNFVDHSRIQLDDAGKKLLQFHCDCPDYRAGQQFCSHCAALKVAFEDDLQGIRSRSLAAVEPEVIPEPEKLPSKQPTAGSLPCLTDFSYVFCNRAADLYPGIPVPRIPLERYIQVFGNNSLAHFHFARSKAWSGSCYGMVATSSMFQQSNPKTCVQNFSTAASIPGELRLNDHNPIVNMTLHTYIELAHLLQITPQASFETKQYLKDTACLENLVKRVEAFQQGKAAPVLMLVFKNPKFEGGHAVLPYLVEHVSATEDRLYIYDPNHPMQIRYAHVEKDALGNCKNWRFQMFDDLVYTSETGGQLSMAPYEVYQDAWENRGQIAPSNALSIAPGVAVKDAAGNVLLRVTEEGVESFREDVYQLLFVDGASDASVALSLPAGAYTFCLEDPRQQELNIYLSGTNLSIQFTTEAREAMLQVEDANRIAACRISQSNSRYAIQILNTFSEQHETVYLNGSTGNEELYLVQKAGKLYAHGLTGQTIFYRNDEQQPLSQILPLEENRQEESEKEQIANTTEEIITDICRN